MITIKKDIKQIKLILFGIQILLFCIIVLLATGCKSSHVKNSQDVLSEYWHVKWKRDSFDDERFIEINNQINRLREKNWNDDVHCIYANIQLIRNEKIVPMETSTPDDT